MWEVIHIMEKVKQGGKIGRGRQFPVLNGKDRKSKVMIRWCVNKNEGVEARVPWISVGECASFNFIR
jgi:hypothetical protein